MKLLTLFKKKNKTIISSNTKEHLKVCSNMINNFKRLFATHPNVYHNANILNAWIEYFNNKI